MNKNKHCCPIILRKLFLFWRIISRTISHRISLEMKHYGSIDLIASDISSDSEDLPSPLKAKLKSIASQCCGVLASDILKFTASTITGFHIILIAELHEESSEIVITLDELTWIASLNFMVPIGSIANGFLTQRTGSRFVMLASSLLFITTWLFYYFATNVRMILVGGVIFSLSNGAVKTSTSTYITEISLPILRGSFLASYHLAATFGMFLSLFMGSFLHWRTIALINIIFPVFSILMILIIPDSPIWLASKGRYEEAQAALSWLRGWVKPDRVGYEYRSLINNFKKSTKMSSCSSNHPIGESDDEDRSAGFRKKLRNVAKPYLHKSFYLPLATMTTIYFVHFFGGTVALKTYSMILFQKMNSPMDQKVAPAVMGAMGVAGALIVFFCIRLTGKRKLIFTGLSIAVCSYFLVFAVSYFESQTNKRDQPGITQWISPIAMIIAIFANSLSVDSIVHMLNSEIFPVSIRYIGSSVGSSIGAIMSSAMSKIFLYMLDVLTLPGLFLYLGFMNFVAIITYYFIFPETEGRTLQEIENHYSGAKKLNDRSN